MAANEILSMIAPYDLERIKQKDPKPTFKAFVVGQEGEARATLVGVGKIVKTWFKDAIGKIARRIYAGMPLFHGHSETNEQEGRERIGEIVGTRTKDIKGKFSAIIATYIYPEYNNLPLDIASVEADVKLDMFENDVHAVNVEDVSAVALGNSAIETPGFPDATFLGAVQAFVEKNTNQLQAGGGNDMAITISEVKDFIKAEKVQPNDVFGRDQLIDDPVVKGVIDAEKKTASAGEYAHRKRTDEAFDKARTDWEAKEKTFQDAAKKLKVENAKTKASDLFTSKAKERKLSDEQIKFIDMKREEDFNPEDPEKLDSEVNKFIDKGLEGFKKEAEIFGYKAGESDTKGGGEPNEGDAKRDASIIPD